MTVMNEKNYKIKPGGVNKTEIESLIFVVFIFVHVDGVDESYTGDTKLLKTLTKPFLRVTSTCTLW